MPRREQSSRPGFFERLFVYRAQLARKCTESIPGASRDRAAAPDLSESVSRPSSRRWKVREDDLRGSRYEPAETHREDPNHTISAFFYRA